MSWTPGDPADVTKMSQMANNDQWLYEHTPRAYVSNTKTTQGLLIAGGTSVLPAQTTSSRSLTVRFGGIFTATPVIVVTPATTMTTMLSFSLRGIGKSLPGADGFVVFFYNFKPESKALTKISGSITLNWIAMGVSSAAIQSA